MANQTIFKRYEYKYLLTADQKKELTQFVLEDKTGGVNSADIPLLQKRKLEEKSTDSRW